MNLRHLCLLLLPFLLLFNCKNKDDKQPLIDVNPAFASYISAYTSGLISKVAPIKVVLQSAYPYEVDEQGVIQEDILNFSPSIDGIAYLEDKNTIKFIPKETLAQGQAYTASLNLKKINDNVTDDLEKFKFQFQVKRQDYKPEIMGLKSTSTATPEHYNLEGKVVTNDVVNPSDLEKTLDAKFAGKQQTVTWKHADNNREHKFTIKGILATDKAEDLELEWNGENIAVDRKETLNFTVPPKSVFVITQVRAVSYPEQYIEVNFSQPLDNKQFLNGLVEIEKAASNDKEEYSDGDYVKNIIADGNDLKIYTSKKIGGDYNLQLFSGIKSAAGERLEQKYDETITLQRLFPEVKFVGTGNLIPETDGLYLPFESVGLNAVRVEITKVYEQNVHQFFQNNQYNTEDNLRMVGKKVFNKVISLENQSNFSSEESKVYQLELSKFIAPEPGAIYNVEFSFDKKFAAYACDSVTTHTDFLTPLESPKDDYYVDTALENDDYYYDDYYYPDNYDWRERNNPCHDSYYTARRNVSRNVLATNLGVIAKIGNDKKANVIVSNLLSAEPESGVEVIAYDLQNQEVGTGVTDSDGFVVFDLTRKPFLIKAKKNKNSAYVRVDDGSSLSLSNFAVDGKTLKNGMAGFIYGERGVWRPGDSIHLTFVLNKSWVNVPEGQPAILELKNPEGQVMSRLANNAPQNGFYTFGLQTAADAKTGNWSTHITLGGLKFNKTLKIETIKPNRLKINTTFPSEVLSPTTSSQYQLEANWLSGATASSLAAKVEATISAIPTKFNKFANYIFDDPSREFNAQEQTIFDGSLSAEGKANVSTKISTDLLPPGMLKLGLFTKVFEPGGDFSSTYETKTYAPYSSYVGLNVPVDNEDWKMLETGKKHTIPVATVDLDGSPVSRSNIDVKVYKIKNSWWYNANDQDLAYYVSREYENLYEEKTISTADGRGKFELNVPDDEWGNYFIRVCDSESGHCTGERIWIDWPNWRSRGDVPMESASILNFKADKDKYEVGDDAKISIPTSLKGRALISIENGMKVISKKWIETKEGTTTFEVPITEEMAPNAYVNITMIQPHSQTLNDMPIRMYGVIPLYVENPELHLNPKITSPKEINPKSDYTVKVEEADGKPMTYTLAVVDEGLLDITSFRTPDIYEHFNQKQSLGVKTWDIYNYVLGAFGGRIESVFAIGGDMAMQEQNKEKINRFKPVVKFLGPFTLDKGEEKSHQLKMDNYVGRVKVMVVAGNGEAYGSSDSEIYVRQPLMTLATLPRVLSPGDKVDMPVTVFAMDKKVKNVSVKVNSNNLLTAVGETTKNVSFSKTGDKIVNFSFVVPDKIGKAEVKVQVSGNGERADQTIELEVRSPNAPITKTIGEEVTNAAAYETTFEPFGLAGTNSIQLQLSAMPEMRLTERLKYLIKYPHGCIEQKTSSGFPQLYLNDLVALSDEQKAKTEENIKSTLTAIKSHQLSGGGLSYWSNGRVASDWGSSYALHFILQAEKKGYQLPVGLKSGLISYQLKEAKHWNYYGDGSSYEDQRQTYRLYTLALAGKANLALMNRIKEKKMTPVAKWHLISAYAHAGQKEIAQKMAAEISTDLPDKFYNYGSRLRDQAVILLALNDIGMSQKAGLLMREIAEQLKQDRWYSTQTTAFSLMAISNFVQGRSDIKGIDAEVVVNGKRQTVKVSKQVATITLPTQGGRVKVRNNSDAYLYASVVNTGTPLELITSSETENLNMQITYEDLDGNTINVSELKQGMDFKAVATITHPGLLGSYNELALTQIFPSGWQIINTRVTNQVSFDNSALEYQDFRDDRVYSYFDLTPNKTIRITTLLNATYAGEYDLPAVYCQAMYNNDIYALTGGKRVKVVRK